MTIRHLRVFIAVCEYGKMSLAAKKLHVAQPSVSQTIAEIENYYNIRVFERLSRKLYITESGKKLLSYARHICSLFDEMEENLSGSARESRLRIGATITVGTCILSHLLRRFEENNSQIKTQIFVGNSGVIENMILNSKLDVGVVEGEIKNRDIIKIPVTKDEIILVCSPEHELGNADLIEIEKLEKYDFIMREPGSGTRELFEKLLQKKGINIREKWICSNSEAIKNAVINGHGLTVISKRLVEKELRDQKLHRIRITDNRLERTFNVVYHKNKYISEGLQNFITSCLDAEKILSDIL